MHTVTVRRTIKAPIEQVFGLLTDHANYKLFPGIKDSRLLREGKTEKNGVGALREVVVKQGWFKEEVTAFERPTRMDYLITETSLPLEHKGGSIRLEKTAEGTAVTWTSIVRFKIPLIGGLVTRLMAPQLEAGFASMLKSTEQRLAA